MIELHGTGRPSPCRILLMVCGANPQSPILNHQCPLLPPCHLVPPFLVLKWGHHRGAFVPRIESRIASRIAFHPSLCNSVMRYVYNKIRVFKSRRHGGNFMNSPHNSRSSQGTSNFLRSLRGLCGKFHPVMQCVYHTKNTVGCNSLF
jgi:hypothetical protein